MRHFPKLTDYKLISFLIFVETSILASCKSDIKTFQILYPNHSFQIGQSLESYKRECKCELLNPQRDIKKKNQIDYVYRDTFPEIKIVARILPTFYDDRLISFYCQFRTFGEYGDLSNWIRNKYSSFLIDSLIDRSDEGGSTYYRKRGDESNAFLALIRLYSNDSIIERFTEYYIEDPKYFKF